MAALTETSSAVTAVSWAGKRQAFGIPLLPTAVMYKLGMVLSIQSLQLHTMHTLPGPGAASLGSCVLSNLSLTPHVASPLSFAPGEPLEWAISPPDRTRGKQGWSSAQEAPSSLLGEKRNNSSTGTSLAVRSENGQRKTYLQPDYYMIVVPSHWYSWPEAFFFF